MLEGMPELFVEKETLLGGGAMKDIDFSESVREDGDRQVTAELRFRGVAIFSATDMDVLRGQDEMEHAIARCVFKWLEENAPEELEHYFAKQRMELLSEMRR